MRNLTASAQRHHFDGFLIFINQFETTDLDAMALFLRELRAAAPSPTMIALSGPAGYAGPYGSVIDDADLMVIRAFEPDQDDSEPASLSPQPWFNNAIQQSEKSIPRGKLVIAIASGGKDWESEGPAKQISFGQGMRTAALSREGPVFDPANGGLSYSYKDNNGAPHQVRLLDGASFVNQLNAAEELKPAGVALWELGFEDQSIWPIFLSRNSGPTSDYPSLANVTCSDEVFTDGPGPVYLSNTQASPGHRKISVDSNGHIVDARFDALPTCQNLQGMPTTAGTIFLTFDDGPNEPYTSEILDILKEENVPATFFVIGTQVLRHQDVLRRMIAEGHQIGNHTFSHPDLTRASDELVSLELNSTERLVQSITGASTRLFRPPYSNDSFDGANAAEGHVVDLASNLGYVTLGADINPEDWKGKSAEAILDIVISRAIPGKGYTIELHDGGGNRAPAVSALRPLINALRAKGFRFVSATEASPALRSARRPIDTAESTMVWAASFGFVGLGIVERLILIAVVVTLILTISRSFVLSLFAFRRQLPPPSTSHPLPTVTVLIPAYNEAKVILKTIASVLSTKYDRVLEDSRHRRWLNRQHGQYRSGGLRRSSHRQGASETKRRKGGRAQSRHRPGAGRSPGDDRFDTVLDQDAIGLLARHFVCPDIGAVAGNVKVGNRINLITRLQAIEYVTSQNFERIGLSRMNGMTVVPGAIGAWRRSAVMQCGGLNGFTLAEDCDLTLDIQKRGYKIAHENGAIAWTEAPATWKGFAQPAFSMDLRDAPVRGSSCRYRLGPAAAWSGVVFIAQHISIHDICSPSQPHHGPRSSLGDCFVAERDHSTSCKL